MGADLKSIRKHKAPFSEIAAQKPLAGKQAPVLQRGTRMPSGRNTSLRARGVSWA